MADFALVVGGAGTGKTTRLMGLLGKILEAGVDPHDVGFVSYTRAAIGEATSRAEEVTGVPARSLHDHGWFRTIHSAAYKCIGIKSGELLNDDKESKQWFRENLLDTYGTETRQELKSDFELSLPIWDVCRQRMEPLEETYQRACVSGAVVPSMESLIHHVERYEQAKRLDFLSDYTDLLLRFAGVRNDPRYGVSEVEPEGYIPNAEAWLVDEAQDNSRLMDRCIRRIIAPARWAYLVGDPFQAIYGFSGSDPSLFQQGTFVRREVLGQSFRCPPPIMDLGERCLTHCSDYWDRGIAPASHDGVVKYGDLSDIHNVDESHGTTLLLARTNYVTRRFHAILRDSCVPYASTDGKTPWTATVRNAGLKALYRIQKGHTCFEDDWASILRLDDLPVKLGKTELLVRGTKAAWRKRTIGSEVATLETLDKWGATETLKDKIATGAWLEIIPFAREYVTAIERHGMDTVDNPRITISTIHGAKGMEADNVIFLTTTSGIVERGAEEPLQRDEEHRLAYVACTRGRHCLTVVNEYNERHRMRVE